MALELKWRGKFTLYGKYGARVWEQNDPTSTEPEDNGWRFAIKKHGTPESGAYTNDIYLCRSEQEAKECVAYALEYESHNI